MEVRGMCEFSSLLWWFGCCFNEVHCNQYQIGSCGTMWIKLSGPATKDEKANCSRRSNRWPEQPCCAFVSPALKLNLTNTYYFLIYTLDQAIRLGSPLPLCQHRQVGISHTPTPDDAVNIEKESVSTCQDSILLCAEPDHSCRVQIIGS